MDQKEVLRGMLQDIINDKMDQATVSMHDYFIYKTKEVAGLAAEEVEQVEETEVDESSETE
jgi:hypothetical protein